MAAATREPNHERCSRSAAVEEPPRRRVQPMSVVAPGEWLVVPDHTRDAQRRAADPRASAWVSANAGAGKTKVLTDRVVRLLLSGAQPGRILCLTFTRTAAARMAVEVFARLSAWVTLPDAALARELAALEGVQG